MPAYRPANRSLFAAKSIPYYIHAPDYTHTSSGIRVLHYLCHALRLQGHEAYLYCNVVSPKLNTPRLTDDIRAMHRAAGVNPIIVYPEVVTGNPENSNLVVRYLLNKPGKIGGDAVLADDELFFAFKPEFIPEGTSADLLYIPTTDTGLFHLPPPPAPRQGYAYYVARAKGELIEKGLLDQHPPGAREISYDHPHTPEQLAGLFQTLEALYIYEPSTITVEAALCGCPVVMIPSPVHSFSPRPSEDIYGSHATCYLYDLPADITRARASTAEFSAIYLDRERVFWEQLDHFVQRTQAYAATRTVPSTTGPSASNPQFNLWRQRKSLQEIDGEVLAERMMHTWTHHPLIHLIIEVRTGESALLADTLDALGQQWYDRWHLSIFAEFPPLTEELADIPQISWIETEQGEFPRAFNARRTSLVGDWLCFLEPGCTLEGHALAYLADAMTGPEAPCLVYCDEDLRDERGEFINPRFNPDWNQELLRSMHYLGPCVLFEKQAILACGDLGFAGSAGVYDYSLRLAEAAPPSRFVHVPEILVHANAGSRREIDHESEREAVRQHLARLGCPAKVDAGFVTGTQCITYQPVGTPQVSIIIPTRDQPGYLQHCVDSLVAETIYPNWELIIIDHDSTDPDALEYIGNLAERPELAGRVKCVRTDGTFNWARLANLGAAQAQGEFLLFLDNDTEIIQPSWLDHLVGLCQQPGMAAVAPRLSCPDGQFAKLNQLPRILGLSGLAGPMASDGSSILEPGYCGRLQVMQEVSALAGSCLLVHRTRFEDSDRFDEINTPVYEAALGLCLRLRERGGRLAWTPWVDVVHRGGISRKRLEAELQERGWLTDSALSERDHLLKHHMPQLANDPHYHRQLSLIKPFAIEPHAVIDWDTRYHSRLRVLGVPLTSGSGEYRMIAPFRALQKAGQAQCCIVHPISAKTQRVINPIELARAAPDTLMLQQAIDDTQIGQLKRYRKFNPDIFVTYAVDDVMGNLPRKHYLYNFQAREGKSRMREGLAHCDRLIVSTQPLADYCRDMIDDIVVVPNRLEKERWLGHASLRRAAHRPRVGWAGAQQHLGDLELIREVVETLKDEVEWIFMGMCPPFLKPFVKEEHGFVPFADYPAKLASLNLDLAIAPLEQHLFNEGKSNLRLLEYGVMGWPVVCTDIYPYQTNQAPVKRVNNVAGEWIEAIRERIHNLDAAAAEGDALRAWVHAHYLLEDHLTDWLAAVTPGKNNTP